MCLCHLFVLSLCLTEYRCLTEHSRLFFLAITMLRLGNERFDVNLSTSRQQKYETHYSYGDCLSSFQAFASSFHAFQTINVIIRTFLAKRIPQSLRLKQKEIDNENNSFD